jgi:PAS domain S-box-containing protein
MIKSQISSLKVMAKILAIIFIVEMIVMLLLGFFNLNLTYLNEAMLDSLLLSSLAFPLIYYLVIKSFKDAEFKATKKLFDYKFAIDQHSIVASTDTKGTILDVNDLFCEISGFSREELIGNNHRILNSGTHDKVFWKNMYRTVAKGKTWHGQIQNKAKSGHLYWVNTTIVPIMGDDYKPCYYIAIRTDISLQKAQQYSIESYSKRLEETVRLRTEELELAKSDAEKSRDIAEEANEAKTKLLANMSHELRTPMHAIMSFSKLALKSAQSEKVKSYLNKINQSGTRLTSLIDNLLDLSKLSGGGFTLEPDTHDLMQIVLDCIDNLGSLIQEKELQMDVVGSDSYIGFFDKNLITQVVVNLLSNAIRYSENGKKISIFLSIEKSGESGKANDVIAFRITDQGIGIPDQELDKIFESFTQSSMTRTKAGGTGLGLSICKQIIELHQGKIWAESPPENEKSGSRFTFIIPVNHQK